MAEENVKLTKTIYSTKSTDGLVDRSFSEFFKSKDPVNIDRFFSIYEELFYDIPKTGEKSHTSVIQQSQEYINNYFDPRDDQITTLTERIIELENELATPANEHPFYSNGTIISTDNDGGGQLDGDNVHYMDRGKKRKILGGTEGPVFEALVASLGFSYNSPASDIVKVIPQVVMDGIDEGSLLELRDLTGQTAKEELEEQTNLLASITVNNWKQELNDIVQPIEDGSISSEILYINLLKNKINNEYSREGSLESQTWKYYQDSINGFTEEEREVGRKLYEIALPKLNKSRQTLAILARIWKERTNFPNINFNSILPQTIVNNQGEIVGDKSGATQVNPITDIELQAFASGDKGRDLFPGVLEGEDYLISLDNLEYNGKTANQLLDEGLIKVKYKVDGYNSFNGTTYDLIFAFRIQTFNFHKNDNLEQQFVIGNRQYTFLEYIYA